MSAAVARRYYVRGLAALERASLEEAMETFRAAVDLFPAFASARIGYAVALGRFGDAPRAAQVLRAGLARQTSAIARAAMWATLGDVLTTGGDFFGAEDAFNQAAQHPGLAARAASGLGRVYGKLGRYADSFAQLRRAAELNAAVAQAAK